MGRYTVLYYVGTRALDEVRGLKLFHKGTN